MESTARPRRAQTRSYLRYVGLTAAPVLALLVVAGIQYLAGQDESVLWCDIVIGTLISVSVLVVAWWQFTRTLVRSVEAQERQLLHDALTGLPNRALFLDRADRAVAEARRAGAGLAVVLVDLDRFKDINETLGHANGDALLRTVGSRLRRSLREVDSVARLGGDEFGLVLPGVCNESTARQVLARAINAISAELEIEKLPLAIEASFGVALFPSDGKDVDQLMRHADIALYHAKSTSASVVLYDAERDNHNRDRLSLIAELRRALERGELVLHFQPKSTLPGGEVASVEALVRWQHPTRGLLYPDAFLPAAEQTGLIEPLTDWVLRAALRQVKAWQEFAPRLVVAVNISARSLSELGLVDRVVAAMDEIGAQPADLVLEITETALVSDPETATTIIGRLHAMGVQISLDDFGRGYTSLAYLRRLPLSEIKIDKSFVLELDTSIGDAAIVRSVIELGHNLGLFVTAEGVETENALKLLATLGCDTAQGYFLSRPLAADRLEGWLRERTSTLAPTGTDG